MRPVSPAGLRVPAPVTGVHLGPGRTGPVTLRLFRPGGTRVAVLAGSVPAQLIALRAAVAGTAVRVLSNRPGAWLPLLRHGADARVAPLGAAVPPVTGPLLVVDDRPAESRGLGDAADWQCRLDVRTPWTVTDLGTFGHADVVVAGTLSAEMAAALGTMFDLRQTGGTQATQAALTALTALRPRELAVVSRGRLQLVTMEATPAESPALREALAATTG